MFRGSSPTTNGVFVIENECAIYTADHVKLIMMINSVTSVNPHRDTQIIGSHAFCFCDRLTNKKITVPDSVWEIQGRAFYGCSVTHLALGSSLNCTYEGVFENMIYLEQIEMPNSNEYFEASDGVLYSSALRNVVLYPIGKSVTTFTIPAETEGFAAAAFGAESAVSTVTTLEVDAKSEYLKVYSGLVYTKNMSVLVKVPPALSGAVTVSDSATVIGSGAFYACRRVTGNTSGITLPKRLLEIREYAFGICPVKQIVLPETVGFVGSRAFLLSSIQSLEFPSSLEIISSYTCSYANCLVSVIIRSAKVIKEKAFYSCDALKSVTLPENLVSIGNLAFGETSIAHITFPEHLTVIGDAFNYVPS